MYFDKNLIENIIKKQATEYYTTGKQNISDESFDALVNEAKNIPDIDKNIFSTGWGYNPEQDIKSSGATVNHECGQNVGSLKKVRTWDEVTANFNLVDTQDVFDISLKLDGLCIVLYYNKGVMVKAVTRGNGEKGVDVTAKMRCILGKEQWLKDDKDFTGAIRGELFVTPEKFSEYKNTVDSKAKNHRSTAIGILNSDIDKFLGVYTYLSFCVYSVIYADPYFIKRTTEKYGLNNFTISAYRKWLSDNFENTVKNKVVTLTESNIKEVLMSFRDEYSDKYNTDGIVITYSIGVNNKKADNENTILFQDAVAYKFEEEVKVTTVEDIIWNFSKNGKLIPVAQISPVELAGTTVKRVTAFNAKYVKENQLGKGSIVTVSKRGEIIPDIQDIINTIPENFSLPKVCPYCGKELLWDETETHLVCFNPYCLKRLKEDLRVWCITVAPVDGLGWKTIDTILEKYYPNVNTVEEFYKYVEVLNNPKGVSEKLFNDMVKKLHLKISFDSFLLGLNIAGLGEIGSKNWAKSDKAKELFIDILNEDSTHELALGSLLQDSVLAFDILNESKIRNKFKLYANLVGKDNIIFNNKEEDIKTKATVVITGTLSKPRKQIILELENKGYKVVNTISNTVSYLITNEVDSNSTKMRKAKELNIPIISEQDIESLT